MMVVAIKMSAIPKQVDDKIDAISPCEVADFSMIHAHHAIRAAGHDSVR